MTMNLSSFSKSIFNRLFSELILITLLVFGFLSLMGIQKLLAQQAHQEDAIIKDYYETTITEPPQDLHLDPFYEKYTDARGIPITTGGDVPDVALLVTRDIILHMLSERPDLRKHMVEEEYRVGVMAVTDSTMDIPEQSDWEKPSFDDGRLTEGEQERYEEIRNMTAEEYWNQRARGMGGKYVTCAEENILGYPGEQHKYYGENILVHEFSHGIHSAIREKDPELAAKIEEAYKDAMANGLWDNHYAETTVAEYWAEGTQYWFNSNYDYKNGDDYVLSSADLMQYDPQLYELLKQVYPIDHHIPMDVFHNHEARVRAGND
jgi:hypothetical protein